MRLLLGRPLENTTRALVCWSLLITIGCTREVAVTPPRVAPPPPSTHGPEPHPTPETPWALFWRSRGVTPAPPPDFLDPEQVQLPEIDNLTDGAISDETATRWVKATMRRSAGDGWAYRHLRSDVANADVLGPPGLNGTETLIQRERAAGAIEIAVRGPSSELVAAGVIAIPQVLRERNAVNGITEFVIVLVFRNSAQVAERVFSDGHREQLPSRLRPGELHWALDAGEFRDDPVVGPLWYQARGYTCPPGNQSDISIICRLVQPRN